MALLTARRTSIALRALLALVTLVFAGFLLLMNDARIASERQYPELAHLGRPVYIGVLIGFIPVFLGILHAWRWVALAGRGLGTSTEALLALRRITRCGLCVWAWFSAGVPAWGIASHGMDPPFISMWLAMTILTWFVILLTALMARALAEPAP